MYIVSLIARWIYASAAGTKWNFLNFFPGFVGGHCIGVDPYYLIHKANELGVSPNLISASRSTNEKMSSHVGNKIEELVRKIRKPSKDISILIKGITFKENVKDIRNSKVVDLIDYLKNLDFNLTIEDPYADVQEAKSKYGIDLVSEDDIKEEYDIIVMAVNHREYHYQLTYDTMINAGGYMLDIRGKFGRYVRNRNYCTL